VTGVQTCALPIYRTRPFLQKSVNGSWEGTQVISLARGVSFTPRVGYGQTYYDRYDALSSFGSSVTYRDTAIGRYTLAGTLRFRSGLGDSDLTETFIRRQRPGSLSDDVGAPDYGIDSNLVALTHAYRPHRSILTRLSSGYDFRYFRQQTVSTRDRVQPISAEIYYTPASRFSLLARDEYRLNEGNRNLIFNGTMGDEEGKHLTAGAGYNRSEPDRYYVNTEFGWANSSGTFRLSAALRSVLVSRGGVSNLHGAQLFEKELSVVKVWHDFYSRLGGRLRPGGVKEITARVEMRLGTFNADRQKVRDWESEWFPERAHGREDRP
jgi:hypothetical protein